LNNILSIDLESWIHFYDDALKKQRSSSSSSERKKADNNYIPEATTYILNLLDKYNQKATFFVIGEIYDWYPDVIEGIEKRGYEIGYHTHTHKILNNSTILEKELKISGKFLERFKPTIFRAPQVYITRDSMSCLKEYGFKYSSSSYDEYKIINIDGIVEIPVSTFRYRGNCDNIQQFPKPLTLRMLSAQIPFGSGLFIALLGSRTSYFINYLNRREKPAILFFHPWQLYRHGQITGLGFKLKTLYCNPLCLPYTFNIKKTLERLLRHHSFISFREYYEQ
jgi:peptidoglycan/xylan/chitin deacetylase (PgdA/CDA1 family)